MSTEDYAAEIAALKAEVAHLRHCITLILESAPLRVAGIKLGSIVAATRTEVAPEKPKAAVVGNRDLLPPLVFGPNGVKVTR